MRQLHVLMSNLKRILPMRGSGGSSTSQGNLMPSGQRSCYFHSSYSEFLKSSSRECHTKCSPLELQDSFPSLSASDFYIGFPTLGSNRLAGAGLLFSPLLFSINVSHFKTNEHNGIKCSYLCKIDWQLWCMLELWLCTPPLSDPFVCTVWHL